MNCRNQRIDWEIDMKGRGANFKPCLVSIRESTKCKKWSTYYELKFLNDYTGSNPLSRIYELPKRSLITCFGCFRKYVWVFFSVHFITRILNMEYCFRRGLMAIICILDVEMGCFVDHLWVVKMLPIHVKVRSVFYHCKIMC